MQQLVQKIKSVNLLAFLLCASMALFSCDGDDGAIGPKGDMGEQGQQGQKGDQGEQGDSGTNGNPGADGNSGSFRSVSFTGSLSGTRKDDVTDFDYTFSYEYSDDPYSVMTEDDDNLSVYCTASPEGRGNFIYLQGDIDDFGTESETFDINFIEFGFTNVLNDNEIFQFRSSYVIFDSGSSLEVTNYAYNEENGTLTFTLTWTNTFGSNNSTENPFTISGDFTMKMYRDVISRRK